MSTPLNFRTAFNGFNREDVVRYIEFISARHTGEINQLNSQIEYLKSKAAEVPAAPAEDASQTDALNSRIDSLLARCAQLEDEAVMAQLEAEEKLQAAQARCAQLEKDLEAALAKASEDSRQASIAQELEAYRRAERAERLAQERADFTERTAKEAAERTRQQAEICAKQICDRANSLLAEATAQADAAADQVSALADQTALQLSQLQAAVTEAKKTLRDAASGMYAIRTND